MFSIISAYKSFFLKFVSCCLCIRQINQGKTLYISKYEVLYVPGNTNIYFTYHGMW